MQMHNFKVSAILVTGEGGGGRGNKEIKKIPHSSGMIRIYFR